MRAVNLLPAPRVEKRQDDGQSRARTTKAIAIAAGLALVCVAVVLGLAFMQARSDVSDRQATLDGLQAEVAQTQAAAAVTAAVAAADAGAPRRGHVGRVRADGLGRPARPALARHAARAPGSRACRRRRLRQSVDAHVDIDLEHRQRRRDVERA